jgi:hypothetical protein
MKPEQKSAARHLATLRKYAPFKGLGSQRLSPIAQQAGDTNVLLRRWKPCPGDVCN